MRGPGSSALRVAINPGTTVLRLLTLYPDHGGLMKFPEQQPSDLVFAFSVLGLQIERVQDFWNFV